ncbi:hypothetical protein KPH14_009395 [Odynerus spinipes]|uniref:Uncharacterized protein n=1 Tax=Odynerus spinipes TaxID=1348599 RepID=A0AAD9RPK3_9HYME|nr:hypothetical protein KPH14_009395 [Odynerus spinipes]
MNLDATWTTLNSKLPYLQDFFRSEYTSYLNTAGTVLLGWLIVSTITQLLRLLIAHLTASAIAIILLCPTTVKWFFGRLGLDPDVILNDIVDKFRQMLKHLR